MSVLDGFRGGFATERVQYPTRREAAAAELERVSGLAPGTEWRTDDWGNICADASSVMGLFNNPKEVYELHIQMGKGSGYGFIEIIGETDDYFITGRLTRAGLVTAKSIIEKAPFVFGAYKLYVNGEKVVIKDTI